MLFRRCISTDRLRKVLQLPMVKLNRDVYDLITDAIHFRDAEHEQPLRGPSQIRGEEMVSVRFAAIPLEKRLNTHTYTQHAPPPPPTTTTTPTTTMQHHHTRLQSPTGKTLSETLGKNFRYITADKRSCFVDRLSSSRKLTHPGKIFPRTGLVR